MLCCIDHTAAREPRRFISSLRIIDTARAVRLSQSTVCGIVVSSLSKCDHLIHMALSVHRQEFIITGLATVLHLETA